MLLMLKINRYNNGVSVVLFTNEGWAFSFNRLNSRTYQFISEFRKNQK